jgi:hypothetical protein
MTNDARTLPGTLPSLLRIELNELRRCPGQNPNDRDQESSTADRG